MKDTSLVIMITLPITSLKQQVPPQRLQQVARGLLVIALHHAVAPVPTPVVISATVVSVHNPQLCLMSPLPSILFSTKSQR